MAAIKKVSPLTGRNQRPRVAKTIASPPDKCTQPFAKRRDELRGLTPAQSVLVLVGNQPWKTAMRPMLQEMDRDRRENRDRRGARAAYTAEQIEMALAYQRAANLVTYKEAYEKLCGADPEPRETLGFTRPNAKRATKNLDGIPSPATVSRHKKRFGKVRRGEAWDELGRAARDYHLENHPEYREECEVLGIDGTAIKIHYTAPIIDPKTGKVTNAGSVTAPDAGYVPWSAGVDKSGHGYNLIPLAPASGVPLTWSLTPLNASEPLEAEKIFKSEDFTQRVLPRLDRDTIGVVTADGAFHHPGLRLAIRESGYVENIHHVSHSSKKSSQLRAAKETALRIPIAGYASWFANGHRELVCGCGTGNVSSRYRTLKNGRVSTSVEGDCTNCGRISITSGKWKRAQNPDHFVEVDPSDPKEEPDYLFGNPLTYNRPLSTMFGNKRMGHGEGLYGTLATRFKLNAEKRWFRTIDDARADVGIVFSLIHALAMEQRRRQFANSIAEEFGLEKPEFGFEKPPGLEDPPLAA
ncbi:MAG TPA: hypothetical protein VFW41_11810 [Gaiellaceae bacterium]|nr:hypothetical protein [Gaiellaceae bacterium]